MKIIVKTDVFCDKKSLMNNLPAHYFSLVPRSFYGETVNLICFSENKDVVIKSEVLKAQKKLGETELKTIYFAKGFTLEAEKQIVENNGVAFAMFPNRGWTDERYNRIRTNAWY
jgi:hypothetical protein